MAEKEKNSRHFKKRVRARMKETGQKYTAAMRDIQAEDSAREVDVERDDR